LKGLIFLRCHYERRPIGSMPEEQVVKLLRLRLIGNRTLEMICPSFSLLSYIAYQTSDYRRLKGLGSTVVPYSSRLGSKATSRVVEKLGNYNKARPFHVPPGDDKPTFDSSLAISSKSSSSRSCTVVRFSLSIDHWDRSPPYICSRKES